MAQHGGRRTRYHSLCGGRGLVAQGGRPSRLCRETVEGANGLRRVFRHVPMVATATRPYGRGEANRNSSCGGRRNGLGLR